MKKQFLSLLTLLVVCVTGAWGVTFTYSGSTGYDAATGSGTTRDGITIVFSGGSHSNSNGGYWNVSAQNTTISITSTSSNISSIDIEHTDGSRSKSMSITTGSGEISGTPGTDATLSYSNTSAENKVVLKYTQSGARVTSIVVTIADADPVDPEITFADGNYIVGGSALDLSTLFTSNSSGAVTYTIKNANGTGAAIDGTNFTATSTGTATVTATQAAVDGEYNAASADATITVAEETCPSGLTITGDDTYTEGNDIELTAALAAGNGEISYQWYKGGTDPSNAIEGETATTLTIASCEFADAGNYYCIASKATCDDAVSAAFAVTVNVLPTCYEFYPATSGDAPAVGDQIKTALGSFGGIMTVQNIGSGAISYNPSGLAFTSKSGPTVTVTLKNKMKVGTIISMTLVAGGDKTRGLNLHTASGTKIDAFTCWVDGINGATNGEEGTFMYTVTSTDGLASTNEFRLSRNNTVYLKSLIVKNGGDEYAEPIVLKADTWTTFSPSFDVNIPSGVTAYKLAYAGGESATASPISETKIKAAEGVLLKASEAGVYQFVKTTGATELDDNILKGTTERTLVSSLKTMDNFYAFDKTDNKFKLYSGEYFPANKAYFETGATLAPSAIRIEFEENGATDIKSVEEKETAVKFFDGGRILIMKNGVVYDALGRVIR